MTIKLLAFGQVVEIAGKSSWEIQGISDSTMLTNLLLKEYPGLAKIKFTIAVNKNVIDGNVFLNDNDVIAILPPFSGG